MFSSAGQLSHLTDEPHPAAGPPAADIYSLDRFVTMWEALQRS